MNEQERLITLMELFESEGAHMGWAIISDDNGHWAVTGDGVQTMPMSDEPQYIETGFCIEKEQWFPTILEALEDFFADRDALDDGNV